MHEVDIVQIFTCATSFLENIEYSHKPDEQVVYGPSVIYIITIDFVPGD